MSDLLFAASGASGRFKRLSSDRYKLVLRGVDERLAWFTDRPERQAGSISYNELISKWDSGFGDISPNSALNFEDKNGRKDTVIFEQSKPKYNAEKDKLVFTAKIHNQQKLDSITGALYDEAQEADDTFTKTFSDFSLFVDNWISKSTSVNFINNSDSNLEFFKIEFNSVDGRKLLIDGLSAGVLAVGAYFGCASCALPAALKAVDAVTGLMFPDTKATIAYNNSFVLKPGEQRRITDVDTQLGFSNDVADVAYHIQSTRVDPGTNKRQDDGIGAVYFDNPTIGYPKAKVIPYASTAAATADFKSVTPWAPGAGDEKSWSAFNGLTFNGKYFGDITVDGSSVKGWDLVVS
jgi:hypothetical protein